MEQFSISTAIREGFQVLVVRGDLDELTAPRLDDEIDGHRDGWPVVVDLSNLEFISSAGLHVLLRDRPECIALVCPEGNVRRVLEIVRADLRLPIFSTLDTAIQSLTLSRTEPKRSQLSLLQRRPTRQSQPRSKRTSSTL